MSSREPGGQIRRGRKADVPKTMTLGPRWRWWSVRAIVLLGVVYLLGVMDLPTLIPYLIAVFAIVSDGLRTWRRSKAGL